MLPSPPSRPQHLFTRWPRPSFKHPPALLLLSLDTASSVRSFFFSYAFTALTYPASARHQLPEPLPIETATATISTPTTALPVTTTALADPSDMAQLPTYTIRDSIGAVVSVLEAATMEAAAIVLPTDIAEFVRIDAFDGDLPLPTPTLATPTTILTETTVTTTLSTSTSTAAPVQTEAPAASLLLAGGGVRLAITESASPISTLTPVPTPTPFFSSPLEAHLDVVGVPAPAHNPEPRPMYPAVEEFQPEDGADTKLAHTELFSVASAPAAVPVSLPAAAPQDDETKTISIIRLPDVCECDDECDGECVCEEQDFREETCYWLEDGSESCFWSSSS